MQYKLGQKVWYQPNNTRLGVGCEYEVLKVGHKWVTFGSEGHNRGRVLQGEIAVDGGNYSSHATLYSSKEEYLTKTNADRAFSRLRGNLSKVYRRPDHITLSRIQEAADLLGVAMGEEK